MSNEWLNIRIFGLHIHFGGDDGTHWYRVSFSRNKYHKANGWPDGYFSVYK